MHGCGKLISYRVSSSVGHTILLFFLMHPSSRVVGLDSCTAFPSGLYLRAHLRLCLTQAKSFLCEAFSRRGNSRVQRSEGQTGIHIWPFLLSSITNLQYPYPDLEQITFSAYVFPVILCFTHLGYKLSRAEQCLFLFFAVLRAVDLQLQLKGLDAPIIQIKICCYALQNINTSKASTFLRERDFIYTCMCVYIYINANRKRYFPEI